MPLLHSPDHKLLEAAQGYAALGMFAEANKQIEGMSRECHYLRDVMLLKISIYRAVGMSELADAMAFKMAGASRASVAKSEPAVNGRGVRLDCGLKTR